MHSYEFNLRSNKGIQLMIVKGEGCKHFFTVTVSTLMYKRLPETSFLPILSIDPFKTFKLHQLWHLHLEGHVLNANTIISKSPDQARCVSNINSRANITKIVDDKIARRMTRTCSKRDV